MCWKANEGHVVKKLYKEIYCSNTSNGQQNFGQVKRWREEAGRTEKREM